MVGDELVGETHVDDGPAGFALRQEARVSLGLHGLDPIERLKPLDFGVVGIDVWEFEARRIGFVLAGHASIQ